MSGHIRHGVGAVRPYLYGDRSVTRFIIEALAGVELERLESGGGAHVELRVGDSALVVEECEDWPATHLRQSTYAYVPDVDAAFARAVALGAEVVSEPENKPYQERACALRDGYGNTWYLATYQPAPLTR
jgi:PhnB protein